MEPIPTEPLESMADYNFSFKIFKNHHLLIPSELLQVGQINTAKVYFLNKYRKDGVGLHSFSDKTDS